MQRKEDMNMRRFWLFRSDIKHLEYYHKYKDLSTFKEKCHDYYLLMPLWMIENDLCKEVVIWRLTKKPRPDIIFDIDGRFFIQRWVRDFSECLKYSSPDISFFRGGFKEYCRATILNPLHFGVKLYLGAGRRITPQYGGTYDYLLYEDERDIQKMQRTHKCLPFYKTASDKIFKPLEIDKIYDICWPANFAQIRHKGQEDFIRLIAKHKLHDLKIVSCGNKPGVGRKLCKKYGLDNITFLGEVDRPTLNKVLNQSAFGINMSNQVDGCPRVSTEVLMSGTPLILRDSVRLLNYYKMNGVVPVNENNFAKKLKGVFLNYGTLALHLAKAIEGPLSFDTNNKKNLMVWRRASAG